MDVGARIEQGAEGGLRYDDPRLNIAWPLPVAAVSDKDSNFDLLETLEGRLAARMSPARP